MTLNNPEEKVILPSPSEKSDKSLCPVCSAPTLCSCRTCKKISYCGKAHQRSHWKQHKPDCFPLIVQEDEFLGARLIATRNIKRGEVILREKYLVSGPDIRHAIPTGDPETIGKPTLCVGCFSIVKSDYLCPACLWPVCSTKCEKIIEHRESECEIFRSSKLQPGSPSKYKYEAITGLRGVLLKENDPIKWEKIKDLDINYEEKRDVEDLTHFCIKFIQDECALSQFTQEDIDSVLRVLSTRAFRDNYEGSNCRNDLHLYHIASFAEQNCIPNSSWRIQANGEIYLRALVSMSFGERVSISHTDVTQGTAVRQKDLWRRRGFHCTCERCTNASELGTFFSTVKCPCRSSDGYLIPSSSRQLLGETGRKKEDTLEWKCNECGEHKDFNFFQEILTSFEIDMFGMKIWLDKNSYESLVQSEERLKKHLGVSLHPNHFEVYKVEKEILKKISKELDGNHWPCVDKKLTNLVEKFVTLSEKWLSVADVLWPGYTEQRGLLLNCLQQGLTISLVIIISMNMKKVKILDEAVTEKQLEKEFFRILKIRREVLDIFCLDPEGSLGRNIAESTVQESTEIKILRKRFNCLIHQ